MLLRVISVLAKRLRRRSVPLAFFANETVEESDQISFVNEARITDDGWVQLSPYGDFDNSGGMQRVQRPDADGLVNEFNRLANLPTRIKGLPWYIGHPDHPNFADRYTDNRAYGRIKKLEARDDGLYANVKWSSKGKELVNEEEFVGHSVNWKVKKIGAVWHPVSLKSVGFTNEPNIPVQPVLYANEKQEKLMLKKLIELLKLKPEATEADVETKVTELANAKTIVAANWLVELLKIPADAVADEAKAKQFVNANIVNPMTALASCPTELATIKAKYATNESELVTVKATVAAHETKITALTGERDVANEKAKKATESRIKSLVIFAVETGRITKAEMEGTTQTLANSTDLESEVDKIQKRKPKLNMFSIVDKAGERHANMPQTIDRITKVKELVNAKMSADKSLSYDGAFAAVQKEQPAMFAQMEQPNK